MNKRLKIGIAVAVVATAVAIGSSQPRQDDDAYWVGRAHGAMRAVELARQLDCKCHDELEYVLHIMAEEDMKADTTN